ncbi:MFS transporter [Brachybacterium phenoliresistens]
MQDFEDGPAGAVRPGPRVTRAHLIWAVGVLAYLSAVAARASFGVVSVEASVRFGVEGTVLGLFGVVQLGTYAAAQIPAGLLLDRWGPRTMMVLGALTMGSGQLLMAVADGVPLALLARLLTGAGDAATLVSILRLTAVWFPSRQVPLFTQLATMVGQLGQAVAAVPFLGIVIGVGWPAGFLSLGALLLVSGLLALAVVRDGPAAGAEGADARGAAEEDGAGGAIAAADHPPGELGIDEELEALRAGHDGEAVAPAPRPAPSATAILREVVTSRGVWSGLFLHCLTLAGVNSFLYLWGVPFLQNGHGLDHSAVSVLLTVNVLVMVVVGPCIGFVTGLVPQHRPLLGLIAGGIVALVWAGSLAVPTPYGMLGFLPLVIGLAFGSATCSVGFDLARTSVHRSAIGTASGFVNIGGFGGALLCVLIVGVVLDLRTGGVGTPSLDDYRVALSAQGIVLLAAATGLVLTARRPRPPLR